MYTRINTVDKSLSIIENTLRIMKQQTVLVTPYFICVS